MTRGLARAGFDLDLRHGKIREAEVRRILARSRIELKSDGKAQETGNLYIEFRCRGRKSGIAVSTAEYWMIEYATGAFVLMPYWLLRRMAAKAYREGKIVRGGDQDATEGILVPLLWVLYPQQFADLSPRFDREGGKTDGGRENGQAP